MTYLIDTDIIIYSLKKVPAVIENMNRHKNDDLFVSAITIGELVYGAEQEKKGLVVADMDLQIAATAISMDMTLVTNNIKHFSKINNLRLENWNNEQPKHLF